MDFECESQEMTSTKLGDDIIQHLALCPDVFCFNKTLNKEGASVDQIWWGLIKIW